MFRQAQGSVCQAQRSDQSLANFHDDIISISVKSYIDIILIK